MNQITVQQTLPDVFAGRDFVFSDVWQNALTLQKEQVYLLEAASGTGKSSFCSYIYGFRTDYSGDILFDEQNIRTLKVSDWIQIRQHRLSILFQEMRLFSELTARANIELKNQLTHYKSSNEIEQ